MYPDWVWLLLLAVFVTLTALLIWMGVLTFLFLQQRKFFKSLFPKSSERDIRKKFEEVIGQLDIFRSDLGNLKSDLKGFEEDSRAHIQKVALLRFNPYGDTGGDQSFAIALLNGKQSGLVLTSLHARSGTRIFAKPVLEGKGTYELSKEEIEVLKKAIDK